MKDAATQGKFRTSRRGPCVGTDARWDGPIVATAPQRAWRRRGRLVKPPACSPRGAGERAQGAVSV